MRQTKSGIRIIRTMLPYKYKEPHDPTVYFGNIALEEHVRKTESVLLKCEPKPLHFEPIIKYEIKYKRMMRAFWELYRKYNI